MDGGSGSIYGISGKRAYNDGDDAGDRNDKQKKRSGDGDDHNLQVSETEYRILCPLSKIGSLIGKGGSIIKALRAECRSKIKVEDPISGSDERVVLVSSSSDQTAEYGYFVCAAQEALLKVHGRITEVDYVDEPLQAVTLRLLVPKSHIGCLLGRGGKIIEEMRKNFDAQIRILPKDQHPPCAASTDELVQVTGDASPVRKALMEISFRLHENITNERTHKSSSVPERHGQMMPSMVASSGGLYSSGSYLQGSTGGLLEGLSYNYGGLYGDVNASNSWGLSSSKGVTGARSRPAGATEEEFMLRILCPNLRIGSIIGKGGVIINKMRETTGAKIKVEEQVPESDERVILVSSAEYVDSYPSPVVQAVTQLFRRLVEVQMDKDPDNKSFSLRLLVPSNQIGCLLGKAGNIVNEMRKATKANIRISPKDVPCKCAGEGDELVQVMGDQSVVHDALNQILIRLRSNLFKAQEGGDARPGLGSPGYPSTIYHGSSVLNSSNSGLDHRSAGPMFSGMNLGYRNMDYGGSEMNLGYRNTDYGSGGNSLGYRSMDYESSGLGSMPPGAREGRDSRWPVKY